MQLLRAQYCEGFQVGEFKTRGPAETAGPKSTVQSDRLAYMADLLSELQTMAAEEGCETLAGLLALSHAEALRKVQQSPL